MPPFQPSHFILESMVLFGLARGSLRRRTPQKGGEVRWDFSSFQWGEMPSLSHLLPVGCKNLLGEWLNPKRNVVHGFIFWYKKLVKAGFCSKRTCVFSGIQSTTHFIEFVVAETKQIVSSNSNVILTRQTCGQCLGMAVWGKCGALACYFSVRICYMFLISKCRG